MLERSQRCSSDIVELTKVQRLSPSLKVTAQPLMNHQRPKGMAMMIVIYSADVRREKSNFKWYHRIRVRDVYPSCVKNGVINGIQPSDPLNKSKNVGN